MFQIIVSNATKGFVTPVMDHECLFCQSDTRCCEKTTDLYGHGMRTLIWSSKIFSFSSICGSGKLSRVLLSSMCKNVSNTLMRIRKSRLCRQRQRQRRNVRQRNKRYVSNLIYCFGQFPGQNSKMLSERLINEMLLKQNTHCCNGL